MRLTCRGQTTITGFEAGATIERSLPGQPGNFQFLASVAAAVSVYADTSVQPGGTYTYRVTALPYQSTIFVSAPGAIAAATTTGIAPHVYLQSPGRDPIGMQGYIGWKTVSDGSWGYPL
jgi:hypothetical protein